MSDYGTNPFGDVNPFADPSVKQASSGQKVETVADFNPFANDQFVAPVQNRGVAAPSAPVLHTTYDMPPTYAPPAAAPNQAATDYLQSRQEELERKAADLDRRERAMQQNLPPGAFPVKPCFYQDINLEIPEQFQGLVKFHFYLWISYSCLLFVNIGIALANFIVSSQNSIDNQSGTTFGLSILYFFLWTPCSFIFWFRPVYNAFRSDSSFFFFVYFFIFFLQFVTNVIQCIGIQGSGSVGWLSGFGMISHTGNTSAVGVGVCMIIIGALFTLLAILCMILLLRVHRLYRNSGASFSKAQAEFAQGVISNRTVQTTAAGVAASAARGAAEQSWGSADNRY